MLRTIMGKLPINQPQMLIKNNLPEQMFNNIVPTKPLSTLNNMF